MSKNLRRMVTIGLVLAMGILPMSANSNIVSAQGQEETKTLIMTREDDIDSFDDLDGMTLDLSDKNIVPDADGKVEIDDNDAVPQGNMARNMIQGSLSFVIEGLSFEGMDGVSSVNRPIQNIYVMGDYIYVTQTYTKTDYSKTDDKGNYVKLHGNVKISKCYRSSQYGKVVTVQNSMNIEEVGHGQNLVPYRVNGSQYFIVCANAINNNPANDEIWEANKVGRITYQAGMTINKQNINTLNDTEYSNKTRTKFDDLRRCAVNLSPDGKKMLMFKQSRQGNVQYSFYDFSEVKRALGSNLSTDRSFRYNDKLAAACDSDVINASNVPNGQLQGIAIDNDSNIYIVSDGDGTYDIRANLSVIFKKSKKTVYYNVYGDINEMIYYCKGETLEIEIEGIQVINDKIYIGIAPREQNLRKKAFIYSIDNGLIHE